MPDDSTANAPEHLYDIEVFRAGDYDARGDWPNERLDEVVRSYDTAHFRAPVTLDHDQAGRAWGWVEDIRRDDDTLVASLSLHDDLIELVRDGKYEARSIELWQEHPDFANSAALKAVTFLGATPPQVKGMQRAEFAEFAVRGGDTVSVQFIDAKTTDLEGQDAKAKTEGGNRYPAEAYAYVPDPEKTSTWKLRLWDTPDKKVTREQLGRAAAAFSPGGFRGRRVQIPAKDVPAVKRRIRSEYRALGVTPKDMPVWIKASEAQGRGIVEFRCRSRKAFESHPDSFVMAHADIIASALAENIGEDYRGPFMFRAIADLSGDVAEIVDGERGRAFRWKDGGEPGVEVFDHWAAPAIELVTKDELQKLRPDLCDDILKGAKTMAEKDNEHGAAIEALTSERDELKATVEAAEAKFAETAEQLTALQAEKARADAGIAVDQALANADPLLPEPAAERIRADFAERDSVDGLDEAIEREREYVEAIAKCSDVQPGGVEGLGESDDSDDETALDKQVRAYMKEHGVGYGEALAAVGPKRA